MPLLGTIGAASARGFGLFLQTAATGYGYIALQQPLRQTVFGGPDPTTLAAIPTQPAGGSVAQRGIIADGAFIALGGILYSVNNGGTWQTWANLGNVTPTGNVVGLNGSIAYNPTGKRAFTFGAASNFKTGQVSGTGVSVTSTGSTTSSTTFSMGGTSSNSKSVLYSPALDTFYVMNFGGGASLCFYVPGSTGAGGTLTSTNSPGNYNAGITIDGYPIQASYDGFGTSYSLRKYLSADLSSFTSFGTISDGYGSLAAQSPWVWCPINGRYYVAAGGSGATVYIRRSSGSSDPQSLNFVGSFNVSGAAYVQSVNLLETPTGHLYVFGFAGINAGKAGIVLQPITFRSTDGGANWSSTGLTQVLALSKNFT